jgi:hypothetical protein
VSNPPNELRRRSRARYFLTGLVAAAALLGASCSEASFPVPAQTNEHTSAAVFGFTHHRPDGNLLVDGEGALPNVEPIDILLNGEPAWVVGAPLGEGSVWVAVSQEGLVQGFALSGREVVAIDVLPSALPPGMPPLLRVADGRLRLVVAPNTASLQTHPVILPSEAGLVFVAADGDLVLSSGGVETGRLALRALPDSRLLTDGEGRILLLADATTRYPHGVVGDRVEAGSIVLVETQPAVRVVTAIPIQPDAVVEGIAPIWADLNGDGVREIVVTVSDAEVGSRIVVYDEAGQIVAEGPPIGRGGRWRHQLAVAPFGPSGELELAVVMTPHIGGIVEFYRLRNGSLDIVATLAGASTHRIGSRNLDMALAGDFDGDGRVELLAPDQSQAELWGIQRVEGGAEVDWRLPIGGRLSTNLAAVEGSDNRISVAAGREDGTLRIWP